MTGAEQGMVFDRQAVDREAIRLREAHNRKLWGDPHSPWPDMRLEDRDYWRALARRSLATHPAS